MSAESAPEGNTPLDENEIEGLIPVHLTGQGQLNGWEQANIVAALPWLERRRPLDNVLSVKFLLTLHRKMFGSTWRWAGTFRRSIKNLGVPPEQIPEALANLLADAHLWAEQRTYPSDEMVARYHHRLVAIHPFPNGNGRHARFATDALAAALRLMPLSWGSGDLYLDGTARKAYLDALRKADNGSFIDLVSFIRS